MAPPVAARAAGVSVSSDSTKATRLYFSFIRARLGLGGESCLVERINVPSAVRDVPVHPDDLIKFKMDSSWSKPIGQAAIGMPSGSLTCPSISLGPGASFFHGRLVVDLGVGLEAHAPLGIPMKERNYLDASGMTGGDSVSFQRRDSCALTWYQIFSGRGWYSSDVQPCLLAEARWMAVNHLDGGFGVTLGYRVSRERLRAENGWDRYSDYEVWKTFGLLDMVVGMPYASAGIYGQNAGRLISSSFGIDGYAGFRHVVSERIGEVASRSDFVFRKPTWAFGAGVTVNVGIHRDF